MKLFGGAHCFAGIGMNSFKLKAPHVSKYAQARSPEYHAYLRIKRGYKETGLQPDKFYNQIIEKY